MPLPLPVTNYSTVSPAALFAKGEQGVWFDPNDLSTLFQDTAGTIPAAIEQPVGLMLDKSKGLKLGTELVTANDGTSTTGWSVFSASGTGSITASNGAFTLSNPSGSVYSTTGFAITTVVGKWYRVTGTIISSTGGYSGLRKADELNPNTNVVNIYVKEGSSVSSPVTASGYFVATSTTSWIVIQTNGSESVIIFDNISVKEVAGNHASQTLSARPTLSARYNLLTKTDQFNDGVWSKFRCAVTINDQISPDGTTTGDKFNCNTTSVSGFYVSVTGGTPISIPSGSPVVFKIYSKKGSRNSAIAQIYDTGGSNGISGLFDLNSGTVISGTTFGTGWTIVGNPTIQPASNGWYLLTVCALPPSGTTSCLVALYPSVDGVDYSCTAGVDFGYAWGADFRLLEDGVNIPVYQRVNTSTDYDAAGFPYYLRFDGADDSMTTSSIDFSGTNKLTVWMGARKNLDTIAGFGFIAELTNVSTSSNGSFAIFNAYGAAGWGFGSRGTNWVEATATSGYTAPITNIVTGIASISEDSIITRINGVNAAIATSDMGTGNYANAVLYLGARTNNNFFFNGRLYQLIIRGAQTTQSDIEAIEFWIDRRTRSDAMYQYSPASLFSNGEEGFWFDNDITTMFQDTAGITPAALEQPVGLWLDKKSPGYSVSFDGSQDYLSVANNTAFEPGAGNFTIEAWVRITSATGFKSIASKVDSFGPYIFAVVDTTLKYYLSTTGSSWNLANAVSGGTVPLNTWTHVALVRNGNTFTPYVNGVAGTTTTSSLALATKTAPFLIGANLSTGSYFDSYSGQISNLRFVKGVAVYTGNFTPPTSPLSPINGTSILTCGNSWSGNPAITLNGNVNFSNLNPFSNILGNHASQTLAARPTLSAKYNQFTYTENFSNAVWDKSASSLDGTLVTAPNGSTTGVKIVENSTTAEHVVQRSDISFAANISYTVSIYAKAAERGWLYLRIGNTPFGGASQAFFNLTNGTVGTQTNCTGTIQSVGNGWYLCKATATATSSGTTPTKYGPASADNTNSYLGDGSSGIYIWGADLRVTNDGVGLPPYQRVNTSTDYEVSGFPYYLRFDGVDDNMSTGSISFTNTDKMTVFASVRKFIDSSQIVIAEFSPILTTNNGSFLLQSQANQGYTWGSKGTIRSDPLATTYIAPITNIVTGIGDISGDIARIRVNGAQITEVLSDQGTGNYGNYPLYIGSRAGSSLWFNGRIYNLIGRGAKSSDTKVINTETWLNRKNKVY